MRVFRDKPAVAGLDEGWTAPPLSTTLDFFTLLATEGYYGELVLCTQPTPDLSFVQPLTEALAGVDNPFYGSHMTYHAARVADPFETARKAKGVLDLRLGWDAPADGSGVAFTGAHCPVVGDEPGKPQDFNYNLDAILAHFAIYGLLGAGGTFHTLGGQFGNLPDERDFGCAEAAAKGLLAFPADTAKGSYGHDTGDEATTGSLRTYRVGRYGVRVRPTNGAPILIGV